VGAAWYRARADLRRRWRATCLLILIVGVAGGALLTTVAGARRSSTAYDRYRDETLASDLDIAFDGPPGGDLEAARAAVAALPEVAVVTQSAFPFIVPAGSGMYPFLDFLAVVGLDEQAGRDVDRPRMLEGRAPDPDRPDEAVIVRDYAREAHLQVGDRVEFDSYAPDQLEPLFTTGDAGPPAGPQVTLTVTGIFDTPTFLSESAGSFTPKVVLSNGFAPEHTDDMAVYPGGFTVRLHHGAADVEAVSAELRELFADTELELTPASEIDEKVDSSIDVIVTALLLCALVAALAGGVAIAQALSRHLAMEVSTMRWLAALGMTRRDREAALITAAIPVAVGGAVLAVAVAIAASPLMPVGIARRAEPDVGLSVDAAVLGLGFVGILVVVMLLAALAAVTVGRSAERAANQGEVARPSRSMLALRRTSVPPPVAIGVGMAIEPRGGTAWAVRSALGAVAFGVAGLLAVVVFAVSVTTLVQTPERYGSPFDAAVAGFSGDILADGRDELVADPDIAQLGVLLTAQVRIGAYEANSHAVESLKGGVSLTLLDGRLPRDASEAVLGPRTMGEADVRIGDEVDLEGMEGTLHARVVGSATFPVIDERSSPGRGVLLLADDLEAISSEEEINHDVVITWADGVDAQAANQALAERMEVEVFSPRLPSDVKNLRDVDALPRALAAFLALLAAVAAVHALASTVRLRQRELAVLRTLGFQRRQLAAALAWQATTIAAVGLLVGVPLGLVLGRVVWREVASGIGVVDAPVTPAVAVIVVGVTAVVVANLAAILPGRAARRVRPAATFRAT
jgi:ABC-type lipoprotein release transport system permease subunit